MVITKSSESKIIKEIKKICKKLIISKSKISTQNLVNMYKVEVIKKIQSSRSQKVKTKSNQVKPNSISMSLDVQIIINSMSQTKHNNRMKENFKIEDQHVIIFYTDLIDLKL